MKSEADDDAIVSGAEFCGEEGSEQTTGSPRQVGGP